MAMSSKARLIAVITTAVVSCTSLTACSVTTDTNAVITAPDIVQIDNKDTDEAQNDRLAKQFLDENSYNSYLEVMETLRNSRTYQNIEWEYQQAYIRWYSKYTEAYNLGIINADGTPTGKLEDIRYSLAKYDRNELERLSPFSSDGTKQDFLKWLGSLYFCTTGADIDTEYPSALFYTFTANNKQQGFETVADVENATNPELEEWFRNFLYIEEENLNKLTNKIYMTKEELQTRATELLKEDYIAPQTDKEVYQLTDGTHVINRAYLNYIAVDHGNNFKTVPLKIYGQDMTIISTTANKINLQNITLTYHTNWQDVAENGALPESYIELTLHKQQSETYRLALTKDNKITITKEQLHKILGV